MTDQDHLERINALTRNARQTWFALLAALVFVGITLMGVEHIDFYGVDRATELPLVSVEVPTRYFFVAAPILIAAIYGYFHLYLIRLWDALGAAPARLNGIRLGDAIAPWLVSDAALDVRARGRKDGATTPRALEAPAALLNLLLAWGFGLFVLAALWWLSMPARTWWMTGIAGVSLLVSTFAGAASFASMLIRLRSKHQSQHHNIFATAPAMAGLIALIPLVVALGFERTSGSTERLAPLNLSGQYIVERPAGWLSYSDAKAEFRADWCRREFIKDKECKDLGDRESDFEAEFERRRTAALNDMRRPDWSLRAIEATDMDFRGAALTNAFLAGSNLSSAQMDGADLNGAQLEGANLYRTRMEGADFSEARMEGADLSEARMEGADFSEARMKGADLSEARMKETIFSKAQLQQSNFFGAQMQKAYFTNSLLQKASFDNAQMQGAQFTRANLSEASLFGVGLEFANFQYAVATKTDLSFSNASRALLAQAQLDQSNFMGAILEGTFFVGSELKSANFQYANLTNANFGLAQLQGALLISANLEGAKFDKSQMQEANLGGSRMHETVFIDANMESTIFNYSQISDSVLIDVVLKASKNNGGAIRRTSLAGVTFDQRTDFRNVFLDGSVQVSDTFRSLMGNPCQWIEVTIPSDDEFFGRWRGWMEAKPDQIDDVWVHFAPEQFQDVTAIPPPPGCAWKTEPMPGAE